MASKKGFLEGKRIYLHPTENVELNLVDDWGESYLYASLKDASSSAKECVEASESGVDYLVEVEVKRVIKVTRDIKMENL